MIHARAGVKRQSGAIVTGKTPNSACDVSRGSKSGEEPEEDGENNSVIADMASLLTSCEFDSVLLKELPVKHRFKPFFQKAASSLSRKRSVLDRNGVQWQELKLALKVRV